MFTKGNTLGKGRKKGSKNRSTEEVRTAFQTLVENQLNQLEKDLMQLEPKDRLRIVIDLSKFILPTLKSTELKTDVNDDNILIDKLLEISDSDFEKIYKND
jgi:hypothetical protein